MSTFTVSGTFVTSTGPTNGAQVDAWKLSRCAGGVLPLDNAPPPSGSPDAGPDTTGSAGKSVGAFQLACPTPEQYAIRTVFNGHTSWGLANALIETDGVPGNVTVSDAVTVGNAAAGGYSSPSITSDGTNLFIQANGGVAGVYLRPTPGSNNNMLLGTGGAWETFNGSGAARNVLDDGNGNMQAPGTITLTGATSGLLVNALSSAGNAVVFIKVTGDTQYRYLVYGDGSTFWGPGNAGQDLRIYRSGTSAFVIDNGAGGQAALTINGQFKSSSTSTTIPGFAFTSVPASANFGGNTGIGVDSGANMILNVATGKTIYTTVNGVAHNTLDDGSGNVSISGAITSVGAIQCNGNIQPGNPGGGATARTNMYSGTGVPSNSAGANGDFYFRTDTPGTANQRLYVKSAGSWVGIL